MSGTSVIDRHEPFIAVAVLTAHQVNLKRGFRQAETRRYLDRWMYWQNLIEDRGPIKIQNTQISRYLSSLVNEGYATKKAEGKQALYRLTRPGIVEMLTRLVGHPYYERREHFFFVYMMVKAYRQQLVKLVQNEGKYFPQALQAHLNVLLDPEILLEDQINHIKRELSKLDKRLTEQRETLELAEKYFKLGKSHTEVLAELDKRFPVGLNPLRRYSVLDDEGTERQRAWELTRGTASRLGYLWLPARKTLQHYLDELIALRKEGDSFVNSMASYFKVD